MKAPENQLIFVVGGGQWQAPIIRKAQSLGYKTLCSNLYSDTEGAMCADYFELADVTDFERNLEIAQEYQPVAIITDQSDIAVRTTAYLNEKLGLRGVTSKAALCFTDKLKMRQSAVAAGVRCPKFFEVQTLEDLTLAASTLGYPFVLKPRSNQSSRGIVVVSDVNEISFAFDKAQEFSNGLSLLAEQFIDGKEVTVEGYRFSDKHVCLASSEKQSFKHNRAIAERLLYPPKVSSNLVAALYEMNNRLVEHLNPAYGITHAEYMLKNDQFYLIEIAVRGGGTKISSHIAPLVSGFDMNRCLIQDALGIPQSSDQVKLSESKYCSLKFLGFKPGIPVQRTLETEILAIDGVLDFSYAFELGEPIRDISDDRSRHAYVICSGKSYDEVESLEGLVEEQVVITYEE
jgi:biotin carboxylase